MHFNEEDIDFSNLSSDKFEELCYDLLIKYEFHSLRWKKGGSDNGRDIECYNTVTNPLLGSYNEKWFVECKNHKKAVNVSDIDSKFAWADAENIDNLLIIASPYLSKSTHEWIEKRNINYNVHIIEAKKLKLLLLSHEDLVIKYFMDKGMRYLYHLKQKWIQERILPSANDLDIIYKNDLGNNSKLSIEETGFIWNSYIYTDSDIELYCDRHNRIISFEKLNKKLSSNTNVKFVFNKEKFLEIKQMGWQIIPNYDMYKSGFYGEVVVKRSSKKIDGIYSCSIDKKNEKGLEVLVLRENKIIVEVAFWKNQAKITYDKLYEQFTDIYLQREAN